MPYIERLKAIRDERGFKNTVLSQLADLPLATVTRIFNGSTPNPTFETFVKLSIALGVSLDEIAGLRQPEAPPLDAHIENTLVSYAELLKERDERLREKDELIASLKEAYSKELKLRRKILFAVGTVMSLLLIVVILLVIIDMSIGHIGYIRY